MNFTTLGIDIAKNVFQLHGTDARGKAVLKKRLSREKLVDFVANLPTCEIVMEACSGSNYWHRKFSSHGHTVKLISPQYVKPFVKVNKNDAKDAEAICEAASRPNMNFVPPKSIEQQDIQCIHRIRERLIANRTALVNQARGLLGEYGIVVAKGLWHLRKELPRILEDGENELTSITRSLFYKLYEELCNLDEKIKEYDKKLSLIAEENTICKRLLEVEGIGTITSTALLSAVGNAKVFKNGRQMSAWLGLTPKEHSSGSKKLLLGITKRGNCYLRKLLIHGARSVVNRAKSKTDPRSVWINNIVDRRGKNRACVALANKNVRVIWSLIAKEAEYKKAI
jgi:transposase